VSSAISIRKATAGDLQAILFLWQELMDFHKQRDPHYTRAPDGAARFRDFVSSQLAAKDSCVLVAVHGSLIIGYCLATLIQLPPVFAERLYGDIFDLSVTADYRRRGVGVKLFAAAQAWFKSRGVRRMETRVATTNEVSTGFWRKMGFRPYAAQVFKNL
jgi:GNAT superfamily N-acetyltransferase